MKLLDQRIKWEMRSAASASVEGMMPSFNVIICSNWLAVYAPGSWWKGVAVYPLSVLDEFLEGSGGRLYLKPLETRRYF